MSLLVAEMKRIDGLIDEYKHLAKAEVETAEERKQLQQEETHLISELDQIVTEKEILQIESLDKLKEQKVKSNAMKYEELQTSLQKMYTLLGYTNAELKYNEDEIESRSCHIKLQYKNNNCYIVLGVNSLDVKYELVEIQPEPSRFDEIKENLERTQNVTDLLANTVEYFQQCLTLTSST